jgi:trigger factor
MHVVVESTGILERKMKVTVPSERIDQQVNTKIRQLSKTAKIDGFRPGKIPEAVIRQRFGKGIEFEVLNEVLQYTLQEALQKENLMPAGSPELDFAHFESGKPFDFTATFEIFPEIELKPFADLIVEKMTAQVTEEDLEKTLEGMRKQRTQWEEVERPAKDGDRVSIAFVGTINGEEFQGGKSDNMPLILGSHSTISGFEEGLINSNKGQEVTLDLTFPENYGAQELAGKPVQFKIIVNKIEQPKLPEFDTEFAETFGIKEGGIDKLRTEVKQTLEQQLSQALRQKVKAEVLGKLAALYKDLQVPKALIRREAEHLQKQAQQQFAQLKTAKHPQFEIDMFMDRAKERVILGLIINEIIKKDKLKADPATVRKLIEDVASRYDHPEQIVTWYYQQKDRLAEMEAMALEGQIVDKILAEATVVEKTTTASEMLSMGGVR